MKSKNRKILKHKVTTVTQDGEITKEATMTEQYVGSQEPYYMVYLFDLLLLKGLSGTTHLILYAILKRIVYGTNKVSLFYPVKKEICDELKISISSIDKAIKSYIEKNILIKIAKGYFLINVNYFGKGEWKDICNIRINLTYDDNGKLIIVQVNKKIEPNKEF